MPRKIKTESAKDESLLAWVDEQIAHWTEERVHNPVARYYIDAYRQVRAKLAGE